MDNTIIAYLDTLLSLEKFHLDSSKNGLQVTPSFPLQKICFAVDVSLAAVEYAAKQKAQLLFVHHGMSWGNSLAYLTGRRYLLVKSCIKHGIGVYAVHAPLDVHPLLGNNAQLFKLLRLKKREPFGEYKGITWGYGGSLSQTVPGERFLAFVQKTIHPSAQGLFFRPVKTIAVVSGGGGFAVEEAWEKGYDTLFTGETSHAAVVAARDLQVNLVFAGHYATERFGVLAVKDHLEKKFPHLRTCFFEHDTLY